MGLRKKAARKRTRAKVADRPDVGRDVDLRAPAGRVAGALYDPEVLLGLVRKLERTSGEQAAQLLEMRLQLARLEGRIQAGESRQAGPPPYNGLQSAQARLGQELEGEGAEGEPPAREGLRSRFEEVHGGGLEFDEMIERGAFRGRIAQE